MELIFNFYNIVIKFLAGYALSLDLTISIENTHLLVTYTGDYSILLQPCHHTDGLSLSS